MLVHPHHVNLIFTCSIKIYKKNSRYAYESYCYQNFFFVNTCICFCYCEQKADGGKFEKKIPNGSQEDMIHSCNGLKTLLRRLNCFIGHHFVCENAYKKRIICTRTEFLIRNRVTRSKKISLRIYESFISRKDIIYSWYEPKTLTMTF